MFTVELEPQSCVVAHIQREGVISPTATARAQRDLHAGLIDLGDVVALPLPESPAVSCNSEYLQLVWGWAEGDAAERTAALAGLNALYGSVRARRAERPANLPPGHEAQDEVLRLVSADSASRRRAKERRRPRHK